MVDINNHKVIRNMKEVTIESPLGSSTQEPLPTTSLIIGSRNRPELLSAFVESILQGNEVPTEIVIVDQSDEIHPTLSQLQREPACAIRYLWSHTVGVSTARNAAIAESRYDILALTDDDMLATPMWFGSLIRALLKAGSKSVVTGRVLPIDTNLTGGFVPSTVVAKIPIIYEGRIGKDVLFTNNMAMYRAAIDHVGLFDDTLGPGTPFPAAEDNDFGFRLLEADYRIVYAPEAVLYHQAWRSERDYLPLYWNYGRGQGAFYAKYLSLRDRYMLRRMLLDIGNLVIRFPRRLWKKRTQAYADAVYIGGLLSGAYEWLLTE